MSDKISASAQKIQKILSSRGFCCEVMELPNSTRSAVEAARAIGCQVEQIAKSLIFKGVQTLCPILVIASGTHRVNERTISELVCEPIQKADADFVRSKTGFVIGGVPPLGHLEPLETFIDETLLQYDEIWAAAGNPYAVFRLIPSDLLRMTDGQVISVR